MTDFAYPPGDPHGVHVANVTAWFRANVADFEPPLRFELIAGGHSNLTFKATDASGREYVLRRPPLAHVLATAHDMGREHRVIKGLEHTPVPVPKTLGLCEDPAVNGASFYVMDYVPGVVQNTLDITVREFTPEQRRVSAESLFDVLADLHAVDIDEVGLGNHGPREGYVPRQLNRWYKQWNAMKNRELPLIDELYTRLSESAPPQGPATVAHGDYRIGNCITSFDGPIAAVLDWEISTLGDPLADLGYLLNTWPRPNDPVDGRDALLPSLAEGMPERADLIERYARRSGRDVSGIGWYCAFNRWKSSCILQGVLARYLGGALGDEEELRTRGIDLAAFAQSVEWGARSADEALRAL